MRLTSVSNMQSLVDDALTSSGLNEHLYPLSTGNLMLSMTSTRKDGSVIHRQVMGLVAAGATRVSNDHRWYDVSAPEQA